MNEHSSRLDIQALEQMTPSQVLAMMVYELYNPVSLLGSHLKRLTDDEEPLTEEEYEEIFEQMQDAVRHLSKMVVSIKQYTRGHEADISETP
jgi:K+-sensing histidine kinase KdpD